MRFLVSLLFILVAITVCADDNLSASVAAWYEGADLPLPEWTSREDASVFRQAFLRALEGHLGPPIGFKAALTNPAAQDRFGVKHPVLGTLLSGMILPNGSVLTVRTARLLVEADLLIVVRDDAFNDASDDDALAMSISHLAPFLELPDGIFPPGREADVDNLIAYNAGARIGIRGALVSLPNDPARALAMLRGISATLHGPDGVVLGRGQSTNLLGDPIRAVRWIRDQARSEGYRFEGGELLSLGSISPPFRVEASGEYSAEYAGLPDRAACVSVRLSVP